MSVRRRNQLVVAVACGCGLAAGFSNPAGADGPVWADTRSNSAWAYDGFVPNQVVVELVPGASIDDLNADYGTVAIASIPSRNLYLLELPEKIDEGGFLATLDADPRVEEAEVNDDSQAPVSVAGDTQPFFFYVQPFEYVGQAPLQLIGLALAHQASTGGGVVVAVLDTGIDSTHEVLVGRVAPGGFNFVDSNTDVADVGNGLDDDGDSYVDEMVGHGTLVAGLIAMVAPDAAILPVKVLDSDGMSDSFRIAQGIYHAIDQGVDVINLSLSTNNHNRIIRRALDEARAAGIVVVAAAGNRDREHPEQLPAAHEAVIGVAATDANDVKGEFSNYGSYVSLSAPGVDIVSTLPGNLYGRTAGTSLSTALVSGAAALIRAADPQASPEAIELLLFQAANDLDASNPGLEGQLGAGRLNVAVALGFEPTRLAPRPLMRKTGKRGGT